MENEEIKRDEANHLIDNNSSAISLVHKKKEWKKNLVILLITVLVMLVLLEIFLRFFYPQKLYDECYEPDPKNSSTWEVELNQFFGWVGRPNYSRCKYQSDTNKIIYFTHNSKGIRLNKEIPYEKGDKKRVVLLGDSFAYGFGLNDSDTIAVRLQENLGEEYEVIPLSSNAYGTLQEYLLLRDEGLKYNPNIVILFFYPNDFAENFINMNNYGDQPVFRIFNRSYTLLNYPTNMIWRDGYGPKKIPLSEQKPFSSFLLKYSHLYSLWFHKKDKLKFNIKKEKYKNTERVANNLEQTYQKEYSLRIAEVIFLPLEIFDGFDKLSKKNNFKFIVVNIPDKINVNKKHQKNFLKQWSDVDESFFDFKKVDNDFSESLLNRKIEYISLFDLAEKNFEDFYFKTDPHWNPTGVKLSADYITQELKNRKII